MVKRHFTDVAIRTARLPCGGQRSSLEAAFAAQHKGAHASVRRPKPPVLLQSKQAAKHLMRQNPTVLQYLDLDS